jgi:hypothetical protein
VAALRSSVDSCYSIQAYLAAPAVSSSILSCRDMLAEALLVVQGGTGPGA